MGQRLVVCALLVVWASGCKKDGKPAASVPEPPSFSDCRGDKAEACLAEGNRLRESQQAKPKGALALFSRACDHGDARGCTLAATLLAEGAEGHLAEQNVAKDPARGLVLYEAACLQEEPHGCLQAGSAYGTGTLGADRDMKKAARYLGLACKKGGLTQVCELAQMARGAVGFTPGQWQAQCEKGDMNACAQAGSELLQGEPDFKRTRRALQLLRKGCEGAEPSACAFLGLAFSQGLAGSTDEKAARIAYQKAHELATLGCDDGKSDRCFLLAVMHQKGSGVPQDTAKSVGFLEKACELGEADACKLLAAKPQ